jgi:hypothetical protein
MVLFKNTRLTEVGMHVIVFSVSFSMGTECERSSNVKPPPRTGDATKSQFLVASSAMLSSHYMEHAASAVPRHNQWTSMNNGSSERVTGDG